MLGVRGAAHSKPEGSTLNAQRSFRFSEVHAGMPTYGYECLECKEKFEIVQKITDSALTQHDGCGGSLRKLLYPVGIVFKGSGFYVNDYARAGQKNGDKPSESKTETKSEAKSETASEAKSETKSESKTESKSETKADVKPAPKAEAPASA
jgi:putative FmdB family regulatory protein